MNTDTSRSRSSYPMAFCALGMAALAVFALVWWGLTPLTAVVAVALFACPIAGFFAWRASRRAEREIEATRRLMKRSTQP